MRLVEALQVMATLGGGFVSIVIGYEQWLLKLLRKQNASCPESAARLPGLRALPRWRLSVLLRHGAVRETRDGRHYLDADGYRAMRRSRLSVVIPATIAAVAIVVLLAFLSS